MAETGLKLAQCPCGNQMEVETGKVDYKAKDDKGQIMSKEACEDMAAHRIRCNECEKTFCANCKASPYHVGMTCEQVRKQKESKPCRFCKAPIDHQEEHKHDGHSVDDVCNQRECLHQLRHSCTKTLECGHPCRGFRGEEKCMPCLHPECAEKARKLAASN